MGAIQVRKHNPVATDHCFEIRVDAAGVLSVADGSGEVVVSSVDATRVPEAEVSSVDDVCVEAAAVVLFCLWLLVADDVREALLVSADVCSPAVLK